MSKWRAVLVGAMTAGALAAGSFIPAQADNPTPTPVKTPIGELHVHGNGPGNGAIVADGDANNPEPLDGSLTLSSGGACTSDDGDNPTGTPTKDCNQDIILSQVP